MFGINTYLGSPFIRIAVEAEETAQLECCDNLLLPFLTAGKCSGRIIDLLSCFSSTVISFENEIDIIGYS